MHDTGAKRSAHPYLPLQISRSSSLLGLVSFGTQCDEAVHELVDFCLGVGNLLRSLGLSLHPRCISVVKVIKHLLEKDLHFIGLRSIKRQLCCSELLDLQKKWKSTHESCISASGMESWHAA